MTSFLSPIVLNNWLLIPLVSLLVFAAAYLGWRPLINVLSKLALSKKDQIMNQLDLMYVTADEKQVTIFLLLSSYGLGTVFFLLLFPNIIPATILAVFVSIIGIKVPPILIQGLYEKRCKKVVNQMVDGMTIMANGIKAGLSPAQSMERVTDNIKGPLSQEFNLVLNKVRLGMTFEEALNEMGERVPMPDVQMLVTSINILKETGGNLAETFQTINSVVRERQKLEKKIEAMTAQGITQGVIISIIPSAMLLMFWTMDPAFVAPLFNTSIGIMCLCLVFTLQIIGGFMIKKMVQIKV